MKIIRFFIVSVVTAFLFVLASSVCLLFYLNPSPEGKQLFINAVVFTMDDQNTVADALLVEKGRVVATGPEKSLLADASNADIINLQGKALIPGFIDIHGHFFTRKMNITFSGGLDDLSFSVKEYLIRGVTSVRAARQGKVKNKPLELLSGIGVIPQRVFVQMNHTSYTDALLHPMKSISARAVAADPKDLSNTIIMSLRSFTIDAARILKVENRIGSIEAGKRADFVVLSDNPLAYPQQLDHIHVDQTWIGGVKRFDRHEFSGDDDRMPASQP